MLTGSEEIDILTGYRGSFREVFGRVSEEHKKELASLVVRFFSLVEDAVDRTEKTGREYAFGLCYSTDRGKITHTSIVEGTESSVDVPKCESGEELIGVVHTHATNRYEKTAQDVATEFNFGLIVSCVATTVVNENQSEKATIVRCDCYDISHPEYEKYRNKILEVYGDYLKALEEANDHIRRKEPIPEDVVDRIYGVNERIREVYDEAADRGVVIKGCYGLKVDGSKLIRKKVEDEIYQAARRWE